MTYWQMALRRGPGGTDMYHYCFDRGIAAIGYYTDEENKKPVVDDCSKLSEAEYLNIWRKKMPKNINGRESLRRMAYKRKQGNIIYVREGIHAIM